MKELRAFILAAGLGTRLRPLTLETPKPLLPVFHKPIIEFALDNLIAAGIKKIAFNTRYLAEKFYDHFSVHQKTPWGGTGTYRDYPIEVFHESEHLDSGGGIRNARRFLEQGPFVIHNGDILTDISINELIEHHRASGALATLLLRESGGVANVHFDEKKNRVVDLRNTLDKNHNVPAFVFASIAVAAPELIDWIQPLEGPVSIVDTLLDAMRAGKHIAALVNRHGFWSDLGTLQDYLEAHHTIAQKKWKPPYLTKSDALSWPVIMD